ncbi:MAG: SpoIIE family protein phosphatase [Oscillospiraceae bacterium]|nr:SpoIIE family protein phosphatase [Oscillospiraceae bacterium]
MERNIHNFFEKTGGYFRYPMIFATAAAIIASELFGGITPLAPIFIGSLAGGDCIFAFLGSLSAFLLRGQVFEAVPALTVMMVIGVFRFFLGNSSSKLLNISSALLTGTSVAIVEMLAATRPTEIISALVMAITAGFLTYCLMNTYKFLAGGFMTACMKYSSILSPSFVAIFAIAALSNLSHVNDFRINTGVLMGSIVSLSLANKYRNIGGSIGGIITAAGIVLANPDLASGMVVFTVASAVATLFTRFGKVTQSAGFIFAMGIGISAIGINTFTLSVMLGGAAGSILYIVVPFDSLFFERIERIGNTGNCTGINSNRNTVGSSLSEIFAERLRLASGALNDVKSAVEKAGEILDKRNTRDFSWVYNAAGDMICRKCKHNILCWGEEYSDTVSSLNKIAAALRKGEALTEKNLPAKINERCERKQQLLYTLGERYREYVSINSANRKITEMRTVLTAQLSATENLMLGLSEEFLEYSHHDRSMSIRVERILTENGIRHPRVAVIINEGRASIEGYGKGKLTCDASRLGDLIGEALQKQFDLPEVTSIQDGKPPNEEMRFTMYERALYGVEYGAYQLSKSNERSCGDYYDSFVDGKGYAYIILSDGMGSGSRARIDSAFACGMLIKLLRAGIGLPSSLEIINNSLLVKSSDESFATLDICRIDLYSGKAELYKAGAAASYIRCNKRLVKAAGCGLPVGIGYKAVYESRSFTIGHSDMVIMASDGAELNEKWLEHQLSNKEITDLNETARIIADAARYSPAAKSPETPQTEQGFREDDISVIAVKLVK